MQNNGKKKGREGTVQMKGEKGIMIMVMMVITAVVVVMVKRGVARSG